MACRKKMSRRERAKQFMPFSPLSGLNEALRRKEREALKVPRPVLPEERQEEIDLKLREINGGGVSEAQITFFKDGEISTLNGSVKCRSESGAILINGKSVLFEDLVGVEFKL